MRRGVVGFEASTAPETIGPDLVQTFSTQLQRSQRQTKKRAGLDCALGRGVDAKDRVVTGNGFERSYRVLVRDREVLTATGGNLAPCLKDWCSLLGRDL